MTEKKIIQARKLLIAALLSQAKKNNLTYQMIADRSGIHQPHVARFFKGDSPPSLDTFLKIAMACESVIVVK